MALVVAEENVTTDREEPVYPCLELTPDLCPLQVEQGTLRIRGIHVTYWKYYYDDYDDKEHTDQGLPIVAIHGGPSYTHNYMLPLQQQACRHRGRAVYFYDQAGCGASLPDEGKNFSAAEDYPWLLDTAYYATVELPALLEHWKLEKFHIIGNSWGTMLAQFYALHVSSTTHSSTAPRTRTSELASMVLSGPFSDSQAYIQAQWDPVDGSLGNLPPYLQRRIHTLEALQAYDSEEYKALNTVLTGYFTLRTEPVPDCWLAAEAGANPEIYVAMQGPSEFAMSGVLAHVNLTARLPEIQVPVLLSHGRYDTMRPSVVRVMEQALPYAQRLYLERSDTCP